MQMLFPALKEGNFLTFYCPVFQIVVRVSEEQLKPYAEVLVLGHTEGYSERPAELELQDSSSPKFKSREF